MPAQDHEPGWDEAPVRSRSSISYDAWAAAVAFIEEHGDQAEIAVVECADALIAKDSSYGRRFFKDVLTAIAEFQRVSPRPGEFVN